MKIMRAEHLGMCFGVRDAITLAREAQREAPVTILGGLVHNQSVVDSLKREGIEISHESDGIKTRGVMITAHGASEKRMRAVQELGYHVMEATCPLVRHAHVSLRKLVDRGCHPVVIGLRGHVEVRGLTEDFEECNIVLTEEDVAQLKPRAKFGVVAQTTQPFTRVKYLVSLIQQRFPDSEVQWIDTVCQPTKQRQSSAEMLAQQCDVVVVIGGADSNNTKELARTCARFGARVHHVQSVHQLQETWFHKTDMVGLTAGTSTPDDVITEVEKWLRDLSDRFGKAAASSPRRHRRHLLVPNH